MHKIGRWILLALFVAFLAGLMPTIFEWCDRFFVFTEEGLGVTRHFTHTVDSVFLTLKSYAWHITIIYAAVIAFVIFMEGQNPDRTILWMLALIFLPVFGVVLYLVIGPDFRSLRKRRLFRPSKRYGFDDTPFPKDVAEQFLIGRMLHACSGAELLMRNRVEILVNGDETFPAIEKALREAKNYIHMEFFIVRSDELGERIGALLKDAAKRGVKVRLLYDAVGSWSLKRSFVKDLEDAGIDCRSFMPVALPIFRRQMNFRNHRKIVVIDGAVGFTGGLNLGTEYEGRGPLGFWRDTFVRLEGEAVPELAGGRSASGETLSCGLRARLCRSCIKFSSTTGASARARSRARAANASAISTTAARRGAALCRSCRCRSSRAAWTASGTPSRRAITA